MTTSKRPEDGTRMPGQGPTDGDLRMDAELTRQELAETVAALGAKADVRARVRIAAHERAEAIRTGGAELVGRLPDPVARRVSPMWTMMSRRPLVPLAGLATLIVTMRIWLKARDR
jgi:hypothetical protein